MFRRLSCSAISGALVTPEDKGWRVNEYFYPRSVTDVVFHIYTYIGARYGAHLKRVRKRQIPKVITI